jgi:hypothetical protein
MTTAGVNITKSNIVATMESVRNTFNSDIVWASNNQPFQTDITGGDTSGYATGSFAADISDTNVTASTIVSNFRSYATLLSRIRIVRLLKYYQVQDDAAARLDYDVYNITNLNSDYQADMTPYGFNAGDNINASNLDQFVGNLAGAISSNRNNVVTIAEYYCHSNCHGNCHGSI